MRKEINEKMRETFEYIEKNNLMNDANIDSGAEREKFFIELNIKIMYLKNFSLFKKCD